MVVPYSEQTLLQPHAMLGVRLHNLMSTHGALIGMYDKIISMVNNYVQSDQLKSQPPLMCNYGLQKHIEHVYQTY